MTGNVLLITLISIIAVLIIFFILGLFFAPIRRLNNGIKNIFAGICRYLGNRNKEKRLLAQAKRKEEIQRLKEKQQKTMVFISSVKDKLNVLQTAIKELEDKENEILEMYEDAKDKILLIDDLDQKPLKFFAKLMNDIKINKLTAQCNKQKKSLELTENIIKTKMEEISDLIEALLDSIEMREDEIELPAEDCVPQLPEPESESESDDLDEEED